MKKLFISLYLLLTCINSFAFQPLPANKAFILTAQIKQNIVMLHWDIAPGYYLYRDRISFEPAFQLTLPKGIAKQDEILGKYQVFKNNLDITLPYRYLTNNTHGLIINYQGCAASGFCYPSVSKRLKSINNVLNIEDAEANKIFNNLATENELKTIGAQDRVAQLLANNSLLFILTTFFGFGLLLAFTPCVLPLLPILSGIIVGQGENITTQKGFGLSLTYVLAMALAYALAGIAAGIAGSYIQVFLQSPWVLIVFSLIFIALALSMFGVFELQVPVSWQEKITKLSNKQTSGSYIGVAVMGILSILIVSPCVTPPLIGALTYIGNTGDAMLGGLALFVMGLGFGLPILILGTLGSRLLPKAGSWMKVIKIIFGILMLVIAGMLLIRAIPGNILQPFVNEKYITLSSRTSLFKPIKSIEDLQRELMNAKIQNKPIILDFYADWCLACKEMDRTTFQNKDVQEKLKNFLILRADVTANDSIDRSLMKELNIIAPPTIVIFADSGNELNNKRIIGEIGPKEFLRHLE